MIGQQVFSPKTKWFIVYFLIDNLIVPNVSYLVRMAIRKNTP